MENIRKYTAASEIDSDEEVCASDYAEVMSDIEKNKTNRGKAKIVKRKPEKKSISPLKKIKLDKSSSYMDKIGEIIENEDVFDESMNSMTVKQDGNYYTFKYPITNGEDYWVLQHYKIKDIKNVAHNERWKHSTCSIKLYTTKQNNKDANIGIGFNNLIETISGRFASDPKKKLYKRKSD